MSLRKRSCTYEDWPLHISRLFLSALTLGLFIGIDILDRGCKIDVWTNIPFSFITISNLIKGMPGIDEFCVNIPFCTNDRFGNCIGFVCYVEFKAVVNRALIIGLYIGKTLMNVDNKYS
jgi:hypothetical protein